MMPSWWANMPTTARGIWAKAPIEAAENAAFRMASPVFASTLTTVIAFGGLFVIRRIGHHGCGDSVHGDRGSGWPLWWNAF
jgi:hypothetical protein